MICHNFRPRVQSDREGRCEAVEPTSIAAAPVSE